MHFDVRESCILVDPANSSQSSKQWVAIVVNHETAHQWFGNLVTMEWWTHLWLNEGEFRLICGISNSQMRYHFRGVSTESIYFMQVGRLDTLNFDFRVASRVLTDI